MDYTGVLLLCITAGAVRYPSNRVSFRICKRRGKGLKVLHKGEQVLHEQGKCLKVLHKYDLQEGQTMANGGRGANAPSPPKK